MADSSFSFNPVLIASNASDIGSAATRLAAVSTAASSALDKAGTASAAAADGASALSKITDRSGTWDKASDASALAATVSNATSSMGATVIRSVPGTGSFAVHEVLFTSSSELKFVHSSTAA